MKGIATIAAAMAVFTLSPAWGQTHPQCYDYGATAQADQEDCTYQLSLENNALLHGIHDEQHEFELRRIREGAVDQAMAGLPRITGHGLVLGAGVGSNRSRGGIAVGGSYGWKGDTSDFSLDFAAGYGGKNTEKARVSIAWRP